MVVFLIFYFGRVLFESCYKEVYEVEMIVNGFLKKLCDKFLMFEDILYKIKEEISVIIKDLIILKKVDVLLG